MTFCPEVITAIPSESPAFNLSGGKPTIAAAQRSPDRVMDADGVSLARTDCVEINVSVVKLDMLS